MQNNLFRISERSEQYFVTECFLTCSWRFLIQNKLEQLELKLEKIIGIQRYVRKMQKTVFYTILPTISIHPCIFALFFFLNQFYFSPFFSLQLLDCFSIPTVLVLSCTVLRSRYRHGFCVSYFLSIPCDFLPREKLAKQNEQF